MSKKREESAIDIIYSLSDAIEIIDKRITVLDSNLKLLNNKFSKLSKDLISKQNNVSDSQERMAARPPSSMPSGAAPASLSSERKQNASEKKLVLGNINTYGYIVDPSKKPIPDVVINVIDSSQSTIKDVRTNKDGYWSVRLPPGKYEVLYKMQGFKPTSRVISLSNDIDKYEVR